MACRVRGVHHDGQVREAVEERDDAEVERVAQRRLERADAALAEDDVRIAGGHDVLGTHQKLLQGRRHAALEEDGLLRVGADLLEEVEVLHVPRADLDDVDVVEEIDVLEVHQLRHDRKPRLLLRKGEEAKPLRAHALEGVGGGARLERAAAQHCRAGGLHRLRDADELVLALDGAGPGDDGEVPAAHLHARTIDHRVLGVELPVRGLVGLLDALDGLHAVQRLDEPRVDVGDVTHAADDRLERAGRHARRDVVRCQERLQVLDLGGVHALLQDDDHCLPLPLQSMDSDGLFRPPFTIRRRRRGSRSARSPGRAKVPRGGTARRSPAARP